MTIYTYLRPLTRRLALSAAVLLIAGPAALADPPGYYFQDMDQPAPATASSPIATDVQIAEVKQKADQALATAQQALRETRQTEESLLKAEHMGSEQPGQKMMTNKACN